MGETYRSGIRNAEAKRKAQSIMFDTSKFTVLPPIHRVKDRIMSMLSPAWFKDHAMRIVHDRTLLIGWKGDRGRAITIEAESDGTISLIGYPVSAKTVFDSMKAGHGCPPNDYGGPVINITELEAMTYIHEDLSTIEAA